MINIQSYIQAVQSLQLFSCFSQEELLEEFSLSRYRICEYSKNHVVHLQNEVSKTMDIVLEGELSVQKIDKEGNILKVVVFAGGDLLGANLLFSSSNFYPMTIVSDTKTVVLHIEKELILGLRLKSVEFMDALLMEVSDKALVLTSTIDGIALKSIREKINDFLKYESYIQKTNKIKLSMSKKDLAQRMGIQRSSLSRELSKMRQEGLIEYDSKTITLKNKPTELN